MHMSSSGPPSPISLPHLGQKFPGSMNPRGLVCWLSWGCVCSGCAGSAMMNPRVCLGCAGSATMNPRGLAGGLSRSGVRSGDGWTDPENERESELSCSWSFFLAHFSHHVPVFVSSPQSLHGFRFFDPAGLPLLDGMRATLTILHGVVFLSVDSSLTPVACVLPYLASMKICRDLPNPCW